MEKIIANIIEFFVRLLKPTIMEQIGPVMPSIIAVVAVGVVIYGIYRRGSATIFLELAGIVVGFCVLIGLLIAFR